jgi:hypothetical protein
LQIEDNEKENKIYKITIITYIENIEIKRILEI